MSRPDESPNGATRNGARPTVCMLQHSLQVGGAEVLAARMARAFAGEFRVVVGCLSEVGMLGEALRAEGFPVHLVGRRLGIDLGCARRLADLFRRERVDLVHAHLYSPFFYSALGRLPGRRPPLLLTEHGRPHPDLINPRTHRITHQIANRLLLRRGDRIVAVGEDVRRNLIAVEGFPPDRIEVIYNGIDLSAFGDPGRDRREARRELGLADGDVALIQVARLHPLKDHATALRALARVVRQRPDVRLVVVGAGPQEAAIARQVRELGLGPFVRLLGRRHDVPRLLGAADLALLSSRSEGIPLALIEAMAAGLPAVATRVGGIPEVVVEGITGALAPAGDDEALAAQILRLVGDPAARAGLAASARRRAFDRFGDDRMLAAYGRAYHEMTGRRPGSA